MKLAARILTGASVVCLAAFFGACGDESLDPKGPFGGTSSGTIFKFNSTNYGGETNGVKTGQEPDPVVINGVSYPVFTVKEDVDGAPDNVRVFMDWKPDRITFAGGQIFWPENTNIPAGMPLVSGTTDTPVSIDLNPPLGQDISFPVSGTAYLGDPSDPNNARTVNVVGTYRMEESGVTVQTAMGSISGARKFVGSTTIEGEYYTGTAYYHPELGLLKAQVNFPPPNGSTLDLTGIMDPGENADGFNTIKAMGVVDSTHPNFRLDTYDVNQAFDADKNTHSKMLIEMRFTDDTYAMNPSLQPQLAVEFLAGWGYFPHFVAPSPISFFHPEDNGKGYTFWWAFVDQAAKNDPSDSMSYSINASWTGMDPSPVKVTARIIYRKL